MVGWHWRRWRFVVVNRIDRRHFPCFHSGRLWSGAQRLDVQMSFLNSNTPDDELTRAEQEKPGGSGSPQLRDLVPFLAHGRLFAVFAERVDGTAEAKPVASLPHAPPAVVGVVCVRGRMLTVLDPVALLTGESAPWPKTLPSVIALRGEEQLALAAETCRDTITVAVADIETKEPEGENLADLVLGLVRYSGEEITVLKVDQLFPSAMQHRERRRRRF